MGTNFYMRRNDIRTVLLQMLYSNKSIDDIKDFLNNEGGDIHIAKTSAGWLPLFQRNETPEIESVADIKKLYDTGKYEIFDEYGTTYTWDEFDKRVLQFNGGTINHRTIQPATKPKNPAFVDHDMPDHIPVSHFEYGKSKHAADYFMDSEGYEFSKHEFC